ncbi:hypothetical protein ACH4PU_30865 [Streptomyces sp. NPDC021100]|uniref:hypothetical protein n=1 Tax=Streptomyces sp. NPDC021100 TaxID=3365114 RepID=UPI00379D17DE
MSHSEYTALAEELLHSAHRIINKDGLNDFHLQRARVAVAIADVYARLADTALSATTTTDRP